MSQWLVNGKAPSDFGRERFIPKSTWNFHLLVSLSLLICIFFSLESRWADCTRLKVVWKSSVFCLRTRLWSISFPKHTTHTGRLPQHFSDFEPTQSKILFWGVTPHFDSWQFSLASYKPLPTHFKETATMLTKPLNVHVNSLLKGARTDLHISERKTRRLF